MHRQLRFILAVAFIVIAALDMVSGASSAGCGRTPTITSKTYTTTINGKQREYIMKLPDNYNNTRPYRIVFLWHPLSGSATKTVNGEGGLLPYYGLLPLANNSAIFVVPNGLNQGWANTGGDDVTFFDSMVKTVEADLCVNTNLRFSTGFSYGGAMSNALACARPKDIRAVSVISGALLSGCVGGTEPVAYYGQHGTVDQVLNVSQGRSLRDKFIKNNGCTPVAETQPNGAKSVKTVYQNCKAGYPVTWVIHNGDHNPNQADSGSSTPFAPGNTWEFFSQFA